MAILLCISIILALCSCLLIIKDIWYGVKHGMKYTFTDTSITSEWDFNNPITKLRLLKVFIDNESAGEIKNKHIEANFEHIKAGHSDNCKKDKE